MGSSSKGLKNEFETAMVKSVISVRSIEVLLYLSNSETEYNTAHNLVFLKQIHPIIIEISHILKC